MTKLGVVAFIAVVVLLSSLARHHTATAQIVGWTCLPGYGGCDEYGNPYTTTANATVGLPFEWHLVAGCNTGDWNLAAVELQTGRLPPGLEFEYYTYNIVGVPTRAGSFSFRLLFRGINCPGVAISDWTRDYTIVATGN
ncbi:MAG TPA: hypothetical protein VF031_05270 [Alphaproteobacteria bacterium]